MAFETFLRGLGKEVYGGLVPLEDSLLEGAAGYLPDLWNEAPLRIAMTHTVLAIMISLLPLFLIGRPRRFGRLSAGDRVKVMEKMMRSRFYLLRIVAYGVKGHALVAVLRKTESRQSVVALGTKSLYGRVSV